MEPKPSPWLLPAKLPSWDFCYTVEILDGDQKPLGAPVEGRGSFSPNAAPLDLRIPGIPFTGIGQGKVIVRYVTVGGDVLDTVHPVGVAAAPEERKGPAGLE
jgi:hypothetical protein